MISSKFGFLIDPAINADVILAAPLGIHVIHPVAVDPAC